MLAVPLPQSLWKMLFTDFCQNNQSSCEKNETEIAEYMDPLIRKRVQTHLWPVVDKDPAVAGGCEGGAQRMAQPASLPSGHRGLIVDMAVSSDGSMKPKVYGQGSWCCCMVQAWAWTVYLQLVVSFPAGGAPWSLLMSSRSCPLMGYIPFHNSLLLQLRKIWSHHQGSPHQPICILRVQNARCFLITITTFCLYFCMVFDCLFSASLNWLSGALNRACACVSLCEHTRTFIHTCMSHLFWIPRTRHIVVV